MGEHAYQARCSCGATWRVYAPDDEDDPSGTCLACGEDTYDLTDLGEERVPWND